MVFTKNLTDHAGAFPVRPVGRKSQVPHSVEYPPMNRFETVSDIRQGSHHNNAHGIVDKRRLYFVFDINRYDMGCK